MNQLGFSFEVFSIEQVLRSRNTHTDSLATLATSIGESLPRIIMVENLMASSWDSQTLIGVNAVHIGLSWMDPVISFFKDRTLLEDRTEVEKT